MVSSKCCHVLSPSPLRFLAALIPPCAHTECERFTGTIENRSTCPPASAILMVAESPARPPPTTMIFGLAIRFEISKSGNFEIESRPSSSWFSNYPITKLHNYEIPSLHLLSFHLSCRCRIGTQVAPLRFLGGNERPHRYHANHHEQDSNRETDYARFTPRLLTGDNSPFG